MKVNVRIQLDIKELIYAAQREQRENFGKQLKECIASQIQNHANDFWKEIKYVIMNNDEFEDLRTQI